MAKIGEILIKKGYLTQEQLEMAVRESKVKNQAIGKTLVSLNLITEAQFLEALGDQMGIAFYHGLENLVIPPEVIKAVPVKFVWHYKIMPIKLQNNTLTIAVSDPMAIWSMEDLKLHLGFNVERVLATEDNILSAIRTYYGFGSDTVEKILSQTDDSDKQKSSPGDNEEIEVVDKSSEDASVINLVNQIFSEAIKSEATDIHLEPYRDKVRLRYRIDGVLYNMKVSEQIKYLHKSIVSRIKILSKLDVIEKRLPQDGRARLKIDNKYVDLRVSIIPSFYGESVVIRILPVHLMFDLKNLGFLPDDLKKMEEVMQRPHGIIFLAGPTGSGKTTTLYACLSALNSEDVKVITIEDPVEYELNGIMQIQIKPEIGFTFAAALRSLLRHDPDIMMVGEVRDLETAELAIRTSLTGHLMFSTLHTNDSAGAAIRLIDIGIEPYLVASSVNAFISQRLVRMICPNCKEERREKHSLPEEFRNITVYQGRGCPECKSSGYKGRTTIYEILTVTPGIQELILKKASPQQIEQQAKAEGFKVLAEVGIEKVKMGITTPEEVLEVAAME